MKQWKQQHWYEALTHAGIKKCPWTLAGSPDISQIVS
jgi:hypothetical protein